MLAASLSMEIGEKGPRVRSPHQPGFYPRRPRDCRSIAPEYRVAGYEVGQRAGEEEKPAKDAEDVEKGEAAGAFLWV